VLSHVCVWVGRAASTTTTAPTSFHPHPATTAASRSIPSIHVLTLAGVLGLRAVPGHTSLFCCRLDGVNVGGLSQGWSQCVHHSSSSSIDPIDRSIDRGEAAGGAPHDAAAAVLSQQRAPAAEPARVDGGRSFTKSSGSWLLNPFRHQPDHGAKHRGVEGRRRERDAVWWLLRSHPPTAAVAPLLGHHDVASRNRRR